MPRNAVRRLSKRALRFGSVPVGTSPVVGGVWVWLGLCRRQLATAAKRERHAAPHDAGRDSARALQPGGDRLGWCRLSAMGEAARVPARVRGVPTLTTDQMQCLWNTARHSFEAWVRGTTLRPRVPKGNNGGGVSYIACGLIWAVAWFRSEPFGAKTGPLCPGLTRDAYNYGG